MAPVVVVRNLVAALIAEEKGLDQGLVRVRDQVIGEEGVPLPAIARVGPPTRGPGNVGLDKFCFRTIISCCTGELGKGKEKRGFRSWLETYVRS